MVSGEKIAAKINYGLGKTGNAAGFSYAWYRPVGAGSVVAAGNLLGSVNAYITTNKALAAQASNWGEADRFAAFDPTEFLSGDYLTGQGQSYFLGELVPIAGMVRLVSCNEIFTWSRTVEAAPGPGYRRGSVVAAVQASGWPGWLDVGDRRSTPELHLQGAVDMPNAQILLPVSFPGSIDRGDQLITGAEPATSWTVQGAVLSTNGWQITAIRAGA